MQLADKMLAFKGSLHRLSQERVSVLAAPSLALTARQEASTGGLHSPPVGLHESVSSPKRRLYQALKLRVRFLVIGTTEGDSLTW